MNIQQPSRHLHQSPLSYETPRVVVFGQFDDGRVHVGSYSSVQHTTEILIGGGHHPEWVTMYPFRVMRDTPFPVRPDDVPTSRGPVIIGSDTWIGWNATILPGVTIGHGAVVGTKAVVAKDVEPYEIVVGNPIRHVGYRFDEPTRSALLRIAWWDWPDSKVIAHADQLCDPDVMSFVARHDPALPERESCSQCHTGPLDD